MILVPLLPLKKTEERTVGSISQNACVNRLDTRVALNKIKRISSSTNSAHVLYEVIMHGVYCYSDPHGFVSALIVQWWLRNKQNSPAPYRRSNMYEQTSNTVLLILIVLIVQMVAAKIMQMVEARLTRVVPSFAVDLPVLSSLTTAAPFSPPPLLTEALLFFNKGVATLGIATRGFLKLLMPPS